MALTRVVCSAVPFHRINAPETKPPPLAVIVKPCAPAVTALGLTNVSEEEDVWTERLVLYCEQAEARPQASNATISHLREHIRTRSSRAILPEFLGRKNDLRFIRVLRNSAMIPFSAGYRTRLIPAGLN